MNYESRNYGDKLRNYSAFNSSSPQRRLPDGLKTVVEGSFEVETQVWSMARHSRPTVRCQGLFSCHRNFISKALNRNSIHLKSAFQHVDLGADGAAGRAIIQGAIEEHHIQRLDAFQQAQRTINQGL